LLRSGWLETGAAGAGGCATTERPSVPVITLACWPAPLAAGGMECRGWACSACPTAKLAKLPQRMRTAATRVWAAVNRLSNITSHSPGSRIMRPFGRRRSVQQGICHRVASARHGKRSMIAAMPCPTPMHIVANP
jgi:hypothetical protein